MRTEHLWDHATAAEINGNNTATKEIKQLIRIENNHNTFHKLALKKTPQL